jgi:transcriptional regulator with XRE-family HTH domain
LVLARRKELGLTQEALAKAAGTSRGVIAGIEKGSLRISRLRGYKNLGPKIAEALGISVLVAPRAPRGVHRERGADGRARLLAARSTKPDLFAPPGHDPVIEARPRTVENQRLAAVADSFAGPELVERIPVSILTDAIRERLEAILGDVSPCGVEEMIQDIVEQLLAVISTPRFTRQLARLLRSAMIEGCVAYGEELDRRKGAMDARPL